MSRTIGLGNFIELILIFAHLFGWVPNCCYRCTININEYCENLFKPCQLSWKISTKDVIFKKKKLDILIPIEVMLKFYVIQL